MKISVCDPCKTEDKKITETLRYMKVRGRRDLRLDVCDTHAKTINGMTMKDYEKYVYKMVLGIDLDAMPTATVRSLT